MKTPKNAFRKMYVPGGDTGHWNSRNARRLAKKNKDVIHGCHSEQMGREAKEEESTRDCSSI
jgi:hypothetical protein